MHVKMQVCLERTPPGKTLRFSIRYLCKTKEKPAPGGGGGGVLNKVLYGEAPSRGPNP